MKQEFNENIDFIERFEFIDFRSYKISKEERSKKIKNIIDLTSQAADGIDNIKKGAIGFAGYGFVFRNIREMSPYTPTHLSSKVCSVGALRGLFERVTDAVEHSIKIRDFNELYNYDMNLDLYFGGSFKTLVPTLEFGGFEIFYRVWFFAKTPDNKMFPGSFYWGPSGTSLSGWDLNEIEVIEAHIGKSFFPKEFKNVINFSPFDFSKEAEDEFIEALVGALDKVSVSDFRGIHQSDDGICDMGIERGEPFIRWIDDEIYEYDEETNSLKKRKFPSEEYLIKVREFARYAEPELQILRQFPSDVSVEESNEIMATMTYFEKELFNISLSISIDMEWLDEYNSEVIYNKMRDHLLKDIEHNNLKEHIDNLLIKIKTDDIRPLTEKLIDKAATNIVRVVDSDTGMPKDFYALTSEERKKAIEIVAKVMTKIITPVKNVDNTLQYVFFKKFKVNFFFFRLSF